MNKTLSLISCIAIILLPCEGYPQTMDAVSWDFSSIEGWLDVKVDPSYHASIQAIQKGKISICRVTQGGGDVWGKVAREAKGVNLDRTPILKVKVDRVDEHSAFKVGVGTKDWKQFWVLIPSTTRPGTYSADIAKTTGWRGTTPPFYILLIVEGSNKSTDFDHLWITSRPSQSK